MKKILTRIKWWFKRPLVDIDTRQSVMCQYQDRVLLLTRYGDLYSIEVDRAGCGYRIELIEKGIGERL